MPDMLVKLYELPPPVEIAGVEVRRALAAEKHAVLGWVGHHFEAGWVSEADVAFSRQPLACWIAVENGQMLGFACYDATHRGFFGPTGVGAAAQGRGIGKALLIAALHAMWVEGYGYAIIGGVGPAEFYAKAVGAVLIEGSSPGVYKGMLNVDGEGAGGAT